MSLLDITLLATLQVEPPMPTDAVRLLVLPYEEVSVMVRSIDRI